MSSIFELVNHFLEWCFESTPSPREIECINTPATAAAQGTDWIDHFGRELIPTPTTERTFNRLDLLPAFTTDNSQIYFVNGVMTDFTS